ncbi:hypothetical protein VNO77_20791 [Canavalia gladiata]|uniref:Late embryogenesis abundant protein LEA-2 subgroup domain-containing protein n=1 Tax=Canavalia gladiata TaxID=3824 RepID=A0AAN9QLQ9_CANGL
MIEKYGHRKKSNMCLVVTCIAVIAILAVATILVSTMLKPRQPITKVEGIRLDDMNMNMNMFKMRMDINVTLKVDMSVENTNKFGFVYNDSLAQLNYGGELIGEAPIPNGEILSEETKGMNLTLTIMADRMFSNSQAFKDVTTGSLPLNTIVKLSGQVIILGLINFHVGSTLSCDFNLNVSNRTIDHKECHHDTKI